MCSETSPQDYPSPIRRNMLATTSPVNVIMNMMTESGENDNMMDNGMANIYMEPQLQQHVNSNCHNLSQQLISHNHSNHASHHNIITSSHNHTSSPHLRPPSSATTYLTASNHLNHLHHNNHNNHNQLHNSHVIQQPIPVHYYPQDTHHEHQYHHEHHFQIQSPQFLPLCDLLFNIISLAVYFCDIVFDSVTVYSLYLQSNYMWFWLTLSLVLTSTLICQILSLKWYSNKLKEKGNLLQVPRMSVLCTHVLQLGVLWRYFKLFIPVDLTSVKHEVRDLCVLRMVHAFCEAAPMLIIQIYLMWLKPNAKDISDLNIISTFLSLFSLCWALASFNKNIRRQNIHKLVLTWLGVIFQFFWRLGTVTSRVVALTVYATLYHEWVLVVIILHWFSMLLWLLSPKNLFCGEKMSFIKRMFYSFMVAWVYIFCYINMQEENSRNKMIAFYSTMFLENTLLLSVCIYLRANNPPWYQEMAMLFVWGGFACGMLFMILYYKFFHIRHLKHTLMASNYDSIEYNTAHCPEHGSNGFPFNGTIHPDGALNGRLALNGNDRKLPLANVNSGHNGVITGIHGIPGVFNCRLNPALKRKKKKPSSFIPPPPHRRSISTPTSTNVTITQSSANNIPSNSKNNGNKTTSKPTMTVSPSVTAFNVVPSPSTFWKKSKMGNGLLRPITPANISNQTSPVPSIPPKHPFSAGIASSPVANIAEILSNTCMTKDMPSCVSPTSLTHTLTNDLDSGGIGSRHNIINIQQKLQEKKQQQLMQLKEIEEEIKQGKINPNLMNGNSNAIITATSPTPIPAPRIASPQSHIMTNQPPQAKKRPSLTNSNLVSTNLTTPSFVPLGNKGVHSYYYHPVYRRVKLRSQTPEVLLAPHYLDNSRVYYDYPSCVLPPILTPLPFGTLLESGNEDDGDGHALCVDNTQINNEKRNAKKKPILNGDMKMRNNKHSNSSNHNNNNYNDDCSNSQTHKDNQQTHHQVNLHSQQQQHQQHQQQQQHRIPSDIDSQVSLPRSYTLPREFRYYLGNGTVIGGINSALNGVDATLGIHGMPPKPRLRKLIKPTCDSNTQATNGHGHPSTSSVDGDVDSDVYQDFDLSPIPKIIRGQAMHHHNHNHTTKSKVKRPRGYYYNHSRYKKHETPL